jgi:hypothetical protein
MARFTKQGNASPWQRMQAVHAHTAPTGVHCPQKSTWTRRPEHHCMQLTYEIASSASSDGAFVFQTIYPSRDPKRHCPTEQKVALSHCSAHYIPSKPCIPSFSSFITIHCFVLINYRETPKVDFNILLAQIALIVKEIFLIKLHWYNPNQISTRFFFYSCLFLFLFLDICILYT